MLTSIRRRLPWFTLTLLTALVPLLAAQITLGVLDEVFRKTEKQRLTRMFALWQQENAPLEHVRRFFFNTLERLRSRGVTLNEVTALPNDLPQAIPVECYVYDESGIQFTPPWSLPENRRRMKRLWRDLNRGEIVRDAREQYRAFLGPNFLAQDFLNSEGRPFPVFRPDGEGVCLWQRLNGEVGLFLLIPALPRPQAWWSEILSDSRLGERWALFDPAGIPVLASFSGPLPRVDGYFPDADHFQAFSMADPTGLVISHYVRLPEGMPRSWRWAILAGALLLSAMLLRYGAILAGGKGGSLETQLIAGFFMATLFPLALCATFGFRAWLEMAENAERELVTREVERLRGLDARYDRLMQGTREWFRRLCRLEVLRGRGSAAILRTARRLMQGGRLTCFESRDQHGRVLASFPPRNPITPFLDYLVPPFLKRFHPQAAAARSLSDLRVIHQVMLSPRLGFSRLLDTPDRLDTLQVGRRSHLWYWNLVEPADRMPAVVLTMTHDFERIVRHFLALPSAPGTGWNYQPQGHWTEPRVPREVRELCALTLQTRRLQSDRCSWGEEEQLVVCYPSSRLEGMVYFSRLSLAPLRDRMRMMALQGAGAGGLLLLLVWLAGRLLSRVFFVRLQRLDEGFVALSRGDFSHRLPWLGGDELGQVGCLFNRMTEDFQRVDFGREWQKTLLPFDSPVPPGYGLAFFNAPATALGGDLAEVLPLDDERFLILIGDVSGHGIASSLLTVIAKTIIHCGIHDGLEPEDILRALDQFIHQKLKRKRTVSLMLGILNHRTHNLTWTDMGHPYPLYRSPDGQAAFQEATGKVLGAGSPYKAWKWNSLELAPGSCCVFYSDGLVEALDEANRQYSYERLLNVVTTFPGTTPADLLGALYLDYQRYKGSLPPEDDLTLLILSRQG